MFRTRSFTRGAGAAVHNVAAVIGRAAAQPGSQPPTQDRQTTTPGWHIGAAQPGAIGVPTELTWRLPAGWRVLASRWPAQTSAVVGRDTVFEYRGPFAIETTLVTDGPQHSGPIQVVVSYGICRDVCLPGRLTLTYDVR